MKKFLCKLLIISLFALIINFVFLQKSFADNGYMVFHKQNEKAEEELGQYDLKIVVKQGDASASTITHAITANFEATFDLLDKMTVLKNINPSKKDDKDERIISARNFLLL